MKYWDRKSQKKWQKSFITSVFANRTGSHNTYSKIIINNPELLKEKESHIPKTLFKFYAPTSDNIIDLQKQRIWCAHPNSFNDPFDCHTGYDVTSYEKHSILNHIKNVGFVNNADCKDGFTEEDFNRINNSTTEYIYTWSSKKEEYWSVMHKISDRKSKEFKSEIYKLTTKYKNDAQTKIDKLRDVNIRVACFSGITFNSFSPKNHDLESLIQMWSHYADNHKGFCVEYDTSSLNPANFLPLKHKYSLDNKDEFLAERTNLITAAGLFPVIYTANRVNIPRTKLQKIKLNSNNELLGNSLVDTLLYKTYIVKSAKWSYEKEWRIIIDGEICDFFDNKLPFPYIKRIFLGCKMKADQIEIIMEIAEELNVEVQLMTMDNKKFLLEAQRMDSYRWDKERSKWRNPLY